MKKSEVDEFNKAASAAVSKLPKEQKLWEDWHQGGRTPEKLDALMHSLEPLVQQHATKQTRGFGGSIPHSAMEAQLRLAALKGIQSYDPDKGTKLKTHVITNFMRTTGFVAANRNFSRIPKNRLEKFQSFHNAKNELYDELGREPTVEELQGSLGWKNVNEVKRLNKEIRRELYIGGNPDPEADDGSHGHSPSQIRSILSLAPSMLTPEERRVFDELYPSVGEPASMAQIAKKTGLNQGQIYRIRTAIYNKVKPHLSSV